MESKVEFSRKSIVIFTIIVILAALLGTCAWQAREENRRDEEIATAEGLARIIGTTFTGTTDLRVAVLKGTIDVTSIDRGPIFDSKLKATLPASVDYFVDLSAMSLAQVRFDQTTRTLFVEVPDVRIAEPNINLAKGKLGDIEGWWASRRASAALVNRAVKLANQKATEESAKPEFIEKARAEGRRRISHLLQLPLAASGMGSVRAVVRYPSDAGKIDERWDESRSIQDVLDEAQQRRSGEKK